ncbi:helix-turn-helix transcriptional regulator [Kribbella sp. NPDC051952]|uniref:helix-turn-helix transcriptional regulator n=1 Tax=Kribbella sp. NPDC051952 TaxID=3154851 RepID=UPI00341E6687
MTRSDELREFLVTRRARITPQQAGLPTLGHRRVPGLRREEVATLTGVSSEYYTRLERGNANGVSDSVLESLARALQLDDAERAHLYNLVRAATPSAHATRRPSTSRVRPAVQRLLDRMSDVPAFIQGGNLDMLAANILARALYCDLYDGPAIDDRTGIPNHGRFIFLDPRSADMYPNWTKAAGDTVTQLRAEAGRRPDDRELNALIGELSSRSPQFAALWATHNVRWHTTGSKHFRHRVVGDLELDYEAMALAADPGHTLVTFTARADSPSEQALAFLASWAGVAASETDTAPTNPSQADRGPDHTSSHGH